MVRTALNGDSVHVTRPWHGPCRYPGDDGAKLTGGFVIYPAVSLSLRLRLRLNKPNHSVLAKTGWPESARDQR